MQTVLLLARDQAPADIVNNLPIGEARPYEYISPVVGTVALGGNTIPSHSLERSLPSISLSLNTFFKGVAEPLPPFRCKLWGNWVWTDERGISWSRPRTLCTGIRLCCWAQHSVPRTRGESLPGTMAMSSHPYREINVDEKKEGVLIMRP
ncbi:hypothetical protein ACEPPN_003461 [Leptodophora sp. 'Broadleaf-Isolate-01']